VPGTVVRVPARNQLERRTVIRSVQTVGFDSGGQWVFGQSGLQWENIANFLTSSNTWANNAVLYDEYRCDSLTLSYIPLVRYTGAGSAGDFNGPVGIFYDADHTTGTMPAVSPASAVCYGTQRCVGTNDPWEITWTMVQPAVGIWYDTSTLLGQNGCITGQYLYPGGLQSHDMGVVVASANVRFRGQKD